MREVFRDNRLPAPGPKMPIIRLKGNEHKDLLVLSEQVQGFWCHWTGRCTIECTVPQDDCRGHQMGFPSKWKGYLHVLDFAHKRQGFLELTPALAEQLKMQLGDDIHSVRGMTLNVSRSQARNGRVKVLVTNRIPSTNPNLPEEVDPLPSLRILWGFVGHRENGDGI